MTGRRLALIRPVFLLATFAPSVLASPPQADQTSYDIALVSERDGQRGIYVMRGDGSQGVPVLAERNGLLRSRPRQERSGDSRGMECRPGQRSEVSVRSSRSNRTEPPPNVSLQADERFALVAEAPSR